MHFRPKTLTQLGFGPKHSKNRITGKRKQRTPIFRAKTFKTAFSGKTNILGQKPLKNALEGKEESKNLQKTYFGAKKVKKRSLRTKNSKVCLGPKNSRKLPNKMRLWNKNSQKHVLGRKTLKESILGRKHLKNCISGQKTSKNEFWGETSQETHNTMHFGAKKMAEKSFYGQKHSKTHFREKKHLTIAF